MTLHLSGAFTSGNVVTAVQTIAGPVPASENDFDYRFSHVCIDVSPSGEYILVTDNYGSSSVSPFNKLNIRPSLVIYQSSSVSGYTPVTEVSLEALSPGTTINGTNYDDAANLLHDWYFLDNETIVGATKAPLPALGTPGSKGNLIFITGSAASWGISYHITSSFGFGYTGDAHSSQRGTTNSDDLPLSGDNFNVGTGSAAGAAIGNWGNTSVDHWKVTPNNTHTDTPATRIAVHATKEVNENGYGSDLITVFKKLEGQTEFSFHSQFSPEDMNILHDTDNQFWSAQLGGSNKERCVQDVVFIEEDIIVVAYISSDANVTDLAPFKYDNSDNKWKPFGYTGTQLTGLDGLVSRAITNINSHGYRWLEYDPHSKRLFVGADSSTINIFNSSSNWLTSLYDGSSGNLGTPSETETYSAFDIGGAERNIWSMPRNTKWRFTPGHALGISIPVFRSTGGTLGADKPISKIFWHESSSAEGWSTYSTSDNYFKVANINENGNSLTGKSDGIATMTVSPRNGTSARYGNMYGWNSQGGGTGDIVVYREGNESSGNSSNFSTSRLIVLDLGSQPAPPPSTALTLTPTSITVSEEFAVAATVVTLNQDPGPNTVNVNVSGLDSTEVVVDQTTQTLTTSNWNTGVTFIFTGQDDLVDDGNQTFSVTFTTTCSSDASFDGLTSALSVTVEDNDTAGFTINPSSAMEINEGSSGTISVVLSTQPESNVVIDVSAASGWGSRASLSPARLTFTTSNWNTSQDVTITTVNDNEINGNQTDTVTFTVNDSLTSDAKFQALSNQTINVTVIDNNVAAIVLIPGAHLSLREEGSSSTLFVKLSSAPTENVTVSITGLDETEATVSPSSGQLTFTPSNWNTNQEFVFTGANDDEADGNQIFTVTLTAASSDSNFDGISTGVTITNVDDDVDTPAGVKESTTNTGTTIKQGTSEVARSLADYLPRKMHFDPSTIENIDRSVLSYLTKLNLFSDTNEGWRRVPIIWGTAERAYQVKHNKDVRDQQGMLKLPLISIRRVSLTKDMPSKGVFQATAPAHEDEQGGSLTVGRMIYQDKTTKFANADAARLHNQKNYPRYNKKVVYRTVSAPMPVNVSVMYEITLRTEYQQQMNNLLLPFITTPGTINYVRLFDGEHRYEAFIQGDMQNNDNLADFSSDERKFETKIQLKVIGYLIGEENNRQKPHYAIRENAVEIKIPRERISLAEIPEMEYGRYYGLEGIPQEDLKDPSPFFTRTKKDPRTPFFFSNVPAVGAGLAADVVAGGSSSSTTDVSTSLITKGNFSETLADNMIVRELLKADNTAPPSPANQLVASIATIRANTESVFVNGMIQALGSGNDYTISGNTITFTYDLTTEDSVYVTYIKG